MRELEGELSQLQSSTLVQRAARVRDRLGKLTQLTDALAPKADIFARLGAIARGEQVEPPATHAALPVSLHGPRPPRVRGGDLAAVMAKLNPPVILSHNQVGG